MGGLITDISRRAFLAGSGKGLGGLIAMRWLNSLSKVFPGLESLLDDAPPVQGIPKYLVLPDLPERAVDFSVWPITGNPASITTHGYTYLQPTYDISYVLDGGYHLGQDFSRGNGNRDKGLPVMSIMDGVCIFKGGGDYPDLGKTAIFRHRLPDGTALFSRYCHLDDWSKDLQPGLNYEAGHEIATMGSSGGDWIAHLHLDITTELAFTERYYAKIPNPFWYPHFANPTYLRQYFLDPAELIRRYSNPTRLPAIGIYLDKGKGSSAIQLASADAVTAETKYSQR